MNQTSSREGKMREIFETAQKMKKGEIETAKSFASVEAFIMSAKKQTS